MRRRTTTPRPWWRVVPVALPVLLLVALLGTSCDGGDDPDAGPTSQSPSPTDGAGLTPPGATLAVGDTATVPRAGDEGVLRVTITEIAEGRAADLASLGRPQTGDETPYYVRYELELVSGDPPYLPIRHILSAWSGDTQLTKVAIFKPFPTCSEKTFPARSAVGTTVSGCAVYVTAKGGPPLNRVQFSNGDDYTAVDGTQISWE